MGCHIQCIVEEEMKESKVLLFHGSEGNISFVSEDRDHHMQAWPLPSECVRVEREHDRHETRLSLPSSEEQEEGQSQSLTAAARAFLAQYVSLEVLEVFPKGKGFWSSALHSRRLSGSFEIISMDGDYRKRLDSPSSSWASCWLRKVTSLKEGFPESRPPQKERRHDKDAKDLAERSARDATPQSFFGGSREKAWGRIELR